MLKRTLEPEVMDSHEEAVTYDEMSHEAVNDLFVTDLLTAGLPAGEILDLGAGTGRIPIELSKREEETPSVTSYELRGKVSQVVEGTDVNCLSIFAFILTEVPDIQASIN